MFANLISINQTTHVYSEHKSWSQEGTYITLHYTDSIQVKIIVYFFFINIKFIQPHQHLQYTSNNQTAEIWSRSHQRL